MNDIASYFVIIFLVEQFEDIDERTLKAPKGFEDNLNDENLILIEADSYYCFKNLLTSVKDFYTVGFPGIIKSIGLLEDLIKRMDEELYNSFGTNHVKFYDFAFEWICCLLLRSRIFPISCSLQILCYYLSLAEDFKISVVYICAAIMMKFSKKT